MDWLAFLSTLSRVLIILTSVCYLYQAVYLFLPLILKDKPLKNTQLHRYAILIAARNEEKVLPHLLSSIRNQDYPQELLHIYVVADNCTDNTAAAARESGARVFSRFNTQKIGKGYALDYLLRQIEATDGLDQFDSFLVFDADNLLQNDYVSQINKVRAAGYQSFCGYRNSKNFGDNWLTASYGLWYLHGSTHLNRSRMRIGSCCAINGTGFGFTRQLLKQMGGWKFHTLTEDLEFNAWCATQGVKIGYCHDAVLYDEQPLSFRQSWRQRTRWAQGGMQVSVRYAGAFLRGIFTGGWVSYASFETATLSLWGYTLAAASSMTALLLTFLRSGLIGFLQAILTAICVSYLSMLIMGGLTLIMEWKRIRATKCQKLGSLFSFPIFMMLLLPITIAAPFQKFQWKPIIHNVAVSVDSLQ